MVLRAWALLLGTAAVAKGKTAAETCGVEYPAGVSVGSKSRLLMPPVGLGCASGVREKDVFSALELGYRMVDTAQATHWGYREDEVGAAIERAGRELGISRSDVWIQTKLEPANFGNNATRDAIHESLRRLRTDYIDSVIIHFPHCTYCKEPPEGSWEEAWEVLVKFFDLGIIGSLGVSNFDLQQLHRFDDIMEQKHRKLSMRPHIVQNWMDPFYQDGPVRAFCEQHGMHYQGYSALGGQWQNFRNVGGKNPVLTHPVLMQIAAKHGVGVPEVVINWQTRLGVGAIPASTKPQHQRANLCAAASVSLSDEDMQAIADLNGHFPGEDFEHLEEEEVDEGGGDDSPDPDFDHHEHTEASVSVDFINSGSKPVDLYWLNKETDTRHHMGKIEVGDEMVLGSVPGHRFISVLADRGDDAPIVAHATVRERGTGKDGEMRRFEMGDGITIDLRDDL